MSDEINMDEYEDYEEPLQDGDFIEVFQPASGGARREKQIPIEEVGAGVNGLKLDLLTIAYKQLFSDNLATTGEKWWTIGETVQEANGVYDVDIKCVITGSSTRRGSLSGKIKTVGDGVSTGDDFVEMTGLCNGNGVYYIKGLRLVKSETTANSSMKIQILLDIASTVDLRTIISDNLATLTSASSAGFSLVSAYEDDTPTVTGDATPALIEAGTELSIETITTMMVQNVIFTAVSIDQLRCVAQWEDIPKQGTGLVITEPSTIFELRDGEGNAVDLSAISYTISNFAIKNRKSVQFYINGTNISSGLNGGACFLRVAGSGGKLTIT